MDSGVMKRIKWRFSLRNEDLIRIGYLKMVWSNIKNENYLSFLSLRFVTKIVRSCESIYVYVVAFSQHILSFEFPLKIPSESA